ncbi:hypothetical protein ACWZHB_24435 [Nocardia sp. FBN12]|uniref:hypothetical protein n=1 Tax=Nocardia sp. FBN12 TaxID=3419766 RepID=UPI003D08BD5F
MDPLTVVDEIFLRTHRGMGTPIALQGLWRTPDAMEPALLQAIHHHLRTGPLGRRVVTPRVPGARRTWHPNVTAHPLDILPDRDGGPLTDLAILPWADSLGADLDPEFAPGWRLSAARLDDGGTVVALTCSHALADARGLIHAITAALRSLESTGPGLDEPAGSRSAGSAQHIDDEMGSRTQFSEWADACSQWAVIIGGTARALRRRLARPARPIEDPSADRVPDSDIAPLPTARNPPSRPGTDVSTDGRVGGSASDRDLRPLLLTFDADHWDTTATALGGTSNSLFIYLIANILWENGFPDPTITASLPVDTRDEPRVDNDLAMTEIAIQRRDTPATIRDKAKAAYQRRMSSPAGLPEQILQVIPDRWAYALSKGAGERDILCSNIGPLPDTVRKVGPHNCTRVAARAIHPGITTFPRTQLSGYLSRLDNTYSLALVGLTADNDSLFDAVQNACAKQGLRPTPW